METDIDTNKSDNRANEFEQQLRMETRAANSNKTDIYLNAYDSSALNHEYKNLNKHDLSQLQENRMDGSDHLNQNNRLEMNPYEDDVQTVHSEGIRSEMESAMPPPLHKRPHSQNHPAQDEDEMTKDIENEICTLTLGDILCQREAIAREMKDVLDEGTEPWGVTVERVEVKDVRVPEQLQRAMAAEAEAAREARAKVIAAEGEHKASRALRHAAEVIMDSPAALQVTNVICFLDS